MRDYEVIVHATADPCTGIAPVYLRYLFRYCVEARGPQRDRTQRPRVGRRGRRPHHALLSCVTSTAGQMRTLVGELLSPRCGTYLYPSGEVGHMVDREQ
ncbi:YxiG-like protein [Micromonospora auratinigra]